MPLRPAPLRAIACVLIAGATWLAGPARAQAVANSSLDAQLFYQLLIGELELRGGDPGNAFQVMLDAARRTKDDQLFRRAVEMALQTRAGDSALGAAKAWRTAVPASAEAHRFLVQILVALDRSGEAVEPLRGLLDITPVAERAALIDGLPRFLGRGNERTQAPALMLQVLQGHLDAPATRIAANVAVGRAWLAAADTSRALEAARRAHAFDTSADTPAVLAIELMPQQPQAEPIVTEHLLAKPASHGVRTLYARTLAGAQRYGDSVTQLESLTRAQPEVAAPYLTLGALQVELRQSAEATGNLRRYVELAQAGEKPAPSREDDDDAADERGVTQAYLLLAQAAEQQRDFKAAEAWLGRIDSPQRALDVQARRASLLARQGKVAEARALIQRLPERPPVDARAKLLAEAQILRDARQWGVAYTLLAGATERNVNDVDLIYEQSMMAEKLNKLDDMERLLRRVIELKPDHHHAYNALGYSLADRGLRLAEAKGLIERALALSPGEPFITDSLGWVEYRLGNRDEALRHLRAAYRARPDVEIAAHLGEVLWAAGQRDEARRVLREARGRDAANDVLRETLARLKVDL